MKKGLAALLAALLLFAAAAAQGGEGWREAYLDFVRQTDADSIGEDIYALVDIDGDDVPELYYNSGYTAGGDRLVLYSAAANERTEIFLYNYGLYYIPGGNLFLDYGGHMDEYYQTVYTVRDGEVLVVAQGEFGAENNADVRYDADGFPIYRYYWNGAEVSGEAAYDACLAAVFDWESATEPFADAEFDLDSGRFVGPGLYSRAEIEQAIRGYVRGE